jgi:hypothetical protein
MHNPMLVQYDTLTTDPAKTRHAIYDFLDKPYFEHDFDNVDYDVTEFDERAGTPPDYTPRAAPSCLIGPAPGCHHDPSRRRRLTARSTR